MYFFFAIHSDVIQRNKTTINDIGQLCIHIDQYVSNQGALFTWSAPSIGRFILWVPPIGLCRAWQMLSIGAVPMDPLLANNAERHRPGQCCCTMLPHNVSPSRWRKKKLPVAPCPVCRATGSSVGSEFPGNPRVTPRNQMQVSQPLSRGTE